MAETFERKPSSSDLLSRLKTRKVLGVGETSGKTSVSKVTQLLGQKSELIEEVPGLTFVFYWNYLLTAGFLITGILMFVFVNTYGRNMLDLLVPNPLTNFNGSSNLRTVVENQRRLFSARLGLALTSIGCTMLYSLTLVRSGGLRIAQFCSTCFLTMTFFAAETENQSRIGRPWPLLVAILVNALCHLHVAFPHWTVWSVLERKLTWVGSMHLKPASSQSDQINNSSNNTLTAQSPLTTGSQNVTQLRGDSKHHSE